MNIPLLDAKLAKEILNLMKVEVPFGQDSRIAVDPWNLYHQKVEMTKVFVQVERWWTETNKSYKTIAAISYWGLPLAFILSALTDNIERVVCLDDEIVPKPIQRLNEEVFLVDDAIKRGTDLGYALEELEKLGSSATQCLVMLDNRSFPWREIPNQRAEEIDIKAVTRVS